MIDHELHPSGNDRVNWPHLDHAESSERLALNTGGVTAWTTSDPHGDLAAATAAGSATIVSALRYDAYGASLDTYTAGSGATAVPWRYQGRLDLSPDPDEPLYDAGARRYRPSLGAFTALDTYPGSAVNPWSLNRSSVSRISCGPD